MSIHYSRILAAAILLLAGIAAAAHPGNARAAQSYDSCTGFIDTLPATITTQGTWCLHGHLSTSIISGHAINIAANNVTVDCNNFRIGGLAAGDNTLAFGINAYRRQNVTVRQCNVRGFHTGIELSGAGFLVEDNRLDNNLRTGIRVSGDNALVQRNQVYDTGGSSYEASGISSSGDVIDNTVAGVSASPNAIGHSYVYGISVSLGDGPKVVRNNRVRGLLHSGNGAAIGINLGNTRNMIDGNQVMAPAGTGGYGIGGRNMTSAMTSACVDNVISGFSRALYECHDGGGNTVL